MMRRGRVRAPPPSRTCPNWSRRSGRGSKPIESAHRAAGTLRRASSDAPDHAGGWREPDAGARSLDGARWPATSALWPHAAPRPRRAASRPRAPVDAVRPRAVVGERPRRAAARAAVDEAAADAATSDAAVHAGRPGPGARLLRARGLRAPRRPLYEPMLGFDLVEYRRAPTAPVLPGSGCRAACRRRLRPSAPRRSSRRRPSARAVSMRDAAGAAAASPGARSLQAGVAAGVAWLIATKVFGHAQPFFAPVSAIITLGLTSPSAVGGRSRSRSASRSGSRSATCWCSVIGVGAWQLALVVMLAIGVGLLPRLAARCSPRRRRCRRRSSPRCSRRPTA